MRLLSEGDFENKFAVSMWNSFSFSLVDTNRTGNVKSKKTTYIKLNRRYVNQSTANRETIGGKTPTRERPT